MPVSRAVVPILTVVGLIAAIVMIPLLIANPSVQARTTDESFQCLAPYDIVLNNAANNPDGDPGLPDEDIWGKCEKVAYRHFYAGLGSGAVAVALLVGATVVGVRRRSSSRSSADQE